MLSYADALKWRSSLKPGDVVCVYDGGFDPLPRRRVVERVTKTQVHVTGGVYTIKYGRRVGDRYSRDSLWGPWTEEHARERREKLLRSHFRGLDFRSAEDFPLDVLDALNAALPDRLKFRD